MKLSSRIKKGVCGCIITALLIGIGGYYINSNTIVASATMNGDLANIASLISSIETRQQNIDTQIEELDKYLTNSDFVIKSYSVDNFKIEAGGNVSVEIAIGLDGYYYKGLMGFRITEASTNGNRWTYCTPTDYYRKDATNSAYLSIKNRSEEQAIVKCVVYVLYVKGK